MDEASKWFLMKQDDGSVFGPMGFDQLRQWAVDAYIAPMDKVSKDGTTWVKAPMIPELQMDYLLTLSSGEYYGPTTVGTVREFLASGEITQHTLITNCKTGDERPLSGFEVFAAAAGAASAEGSGEGGEELSAKANLQARLMDLETALLAERRFREQAEAVFCRIAELEAALAEERRLREQADILCSEMESRVAELEGRQR
jgi:hypothetical protein